MSTDTYPYDVFLSYSAKDNAVVRSFSLSASNGERFLPNGISRSEPLNRALVGCGVLTAPPKSGGVRVVQRRAEGGVPHPCRFMEPGTFRFRAPLKRKRRFIPRRLDDAPNKASRAHFLWFEEPRTLLLSRPWN
ncbi:hypothetical protein LBMAG56_28750 [Verrucomicrobiota bacterium]|nr:hypothetical protein LBMAG56_28750 [Verrucomicrobiota bacterium]